MLIILVGLLACARSKPDPDVINEPLEGITKFELSPEVVEAGGLVNLTWKATATILNDVPLVCDLIALSTEGELVTRVACEDSLSLRPISDTRYQLIATQGQRSWESELLAVTVTAPSQNVAPFVENDDYRLSRGSSLRVAASKGVLANDSDVNGDRLSVRLVDDVNSGTLQLSADGSFVYSHSGTGPNVDFFSYVAHDGQLDSSTATVVLNLFSPPSTQPDSYIGEAGETLMVSVENGVLANDGLSIDYVAQLSKPTQFGLLQLNPDGSFSYTPDELIVLRDSFSYIANNGEFSSLATTVSIDLNP